MQCRDSRIFVKQPAPSETGCGRCHLERRNTGTAWRDLREPYREPDSPFSMGLTRGQFLSVFLVLVGAAFFVYAFKARQTVQECAFYEPEKKDGKESSGKAV